MTSRRFYLMTATIVAVSMLASVRANADDAARDWSQSMGYKSASQAANDFNAALVIRNLRAGGTGVGGGSTINCQVAGACPQGGTVTQWNGVTVNSVTDSRGITIDNTIAADSSQGADIGTCSATSGCVIELK